MRKVIFLGEEREITGRDFKLSTRLQAYKRSPKPRATTRWFGLRLYYLDSRYSGEESHKLAKIRAKEIRKQDITLARIRCSSAISWDVWVCSNQKGGATETPICSNRWYQ